MSVEASYFRVSWFFELWVRLIEYPTRKLEVRQSADLGPRRLIISPPSDAGLPILTRANATGTTELLCFSERLRRIADDFRIQRGVPELATAVQPFFKIPVANRSLSVIYANCLFDFCTHEEIDLVLREVWRALAPTGVLLAVYMTHSSSRTGRLWEWLFKHLTFLSNDCHPISLSGHLGRNGYLILREGPATRFGFPAWFCVCEKLDERPGPRNNCGYR